MEDLNNKPMTALEFADAMIGLGLTAALIILCLQVFTPFMGIMVWALIIAVMLFPAHQKLASRMGGRQRLQPRQPASGFSVVNLSGLSSD